MVTNSRREVPHGLVGLLVTLAAALLGGAYFVYLRATPFPPDGARIVPLVWLLGALLGLVFALRTLSHGLQSRHDTVGLTLAAIGALLALPNLALAAIFAFAALMGD